jgi:integrase
MTAVQNGSSRTMPLSSSATAIVKHLFRGDEKPTEGRVWEWSADYITREFIRLCASNGFEDLRFHDLRHEATSRLFEKGLSLMELASITGHKSLQMLNRYTHLSNDHLLAKLG